MPLSVKKILVPTDFSDASINAIEYAAFISKETAAEILLIHVMESYEFNTSLKQKAKQSIDIKKQVEDQLKQLKDKTPGLKGIKVSTKVMTGKIYKQILEQINKEKVSMVVMATHGSSFNDEDERSRFMLGSNADKVLHGAKCPVLTIRNKKSPIQFKSIILPLDITKETTEKVDYAIQFAKQFGGILHLVNVSTLIDDFRSDIGKLKVRLKNIADDIRKARVKCTIKVMRYQSVSDSISEYSKIMKGDVVIIMKTQEGAWNKFGLGARARKVVSGSEIPVISLTPAE